MIKSLENLKGVTPRRLEKLNQMGIKTISDLVSHLPRTYFDYSHIYTLDDALQNPDKRILVCVKAVSQKRIPTRRRVPFYQIKIMDEIASATLLSFGFQNRQMEVGSSNLYLISGVFKYRQGRLECSQFTVEGTLKETENRDIKMKDYAQIVPVYPLSNGMTQKILQALIRGALQDLKDSMKENLPSSFLQKYKYPNRWESLYEVHFPKDWQTLEKARNRIKYSELFRLQFHFALKQHYFKVSKPRNYRSTTPTMDKVCKSLPFTLTKDQQKALSEIEEDILSPRAMHRLLMGDVGSGKTLVAFLSLLKVIDNGYQGVFLAPTEILAKQHFQTFSRFISAFECKIDLLTGSTKPKERREILISLLKGETQLLIGTHAVFSEDIRFHSLGMVVIDEQHKFGVNQRMELVKKGDTPDVLVMSATPIPRTLGYVQFGDMDISVIMHKPEGRLPITTTWVEESEIDKAYNKMKEEVRQGHQGYIVYPLVEESDKSSRKSVREGFSFLQKHIFPELKLSLLHGQMSDDEKNAAIKSFQKKESDILVSTIVIEVGVDVPNATCLIIENAPTFGLSTLHQLRGRVGRSALASSCFLVSGPKKSLTFEGSSRMECMEESQDGFYLAQKDMELRGSGNLLGRNQSGGSGLKISNIVTDKEILEKARQDAFEILKKDPHCEKKEHWPLKPLLLKFEKEIHDLLRN